MEKTTAVAVPVSPLETSASNLGTPQGSHSPGARITSSSGASTFTWNAATGAEIKRRQKRKLTEEEIQRSLKLREAGGACEDCRKGKRKCSHVTTASGAPTIRTRALREPSVPSSLKSARDSSRSRISTTDDDGNYRRTHLKALAETIWEDINTKEPTLTTMAKDQYDAWITTADQSHTTARARANQEMASLEGFIKECRRFFDEAGLRNISQWRRLKRWAEALIPDVAQDMPDKAPWSQTVEHSTREGFPPSDLANIGESLPSHVYCDHEMRATGDLWTPPAPASPRVSVPTNPFALITTTSPSTSSMGQSYQAYDTVDPIPITMDQFDMDGWLEAATFPLASDMQRSSPFSGVEERYRTTYAEAASNRQPSRALQWPNVSSPTAQRTSHASGSGLQLPMPGRPSLQDFDTPRTRGLDRCDDQSVLPSTSSTVLARSSTRRPPNIHEKVTSRPHKCHSCKWAFINPKDLRRHEIVHRNIDDVRFSCSVCARQFTRRDNLRRHMYLQHPHEPSTPT